MVLDPYAALDRRPRLPVALLPTPLHALDRLRGLLGPGCPRLLIKRDDLTGLALGGNKSRKLEYLLADARAGGADTLITCGAAQSNHALQTAAAGMEYGFGVRCVLYGDPPPAGATLSGNVLLHGLLDTQIRWVRMAEGEARREQALRRGIEEEARAVEEEGGRPYRIPTGGSTGVGALGYVRAVRELREQLGAEAGALRSIFFASGSGGTHAGLAVGAILSEWPAACTGVEIDPIPAGPDGVSPFQRAIVTIAQETAALAGLARPVTAEDITLGARYTGPAYGVETREGREAARLLFRAEGILLDPVYTAKAFAAMLGAITRGEFAPDDRVLFWHTGGAPGIFAAH